MPARKNTAAYRAPSREGVASPAEPDRAAALPSLELTPMSEVRRRDEGE